MNYTNKSSIIADLVLLGLTAIAASTFIGNEILVSVISPIFLITLRFICSALILLLIFPSVLKGINSGVIKGALSIGAGYGLGSAFLFIALQNTRSAHAAFIISMEVVLVPLYLYIFEKTKPHKSEWIALPFALCGLWLITIGDSGHFKWGDLLLVLSSCAYALYTISLSKYAPRYNLPQLSFLAFVFIALFFGMLTLLFGNPIIGKWQNSYWSIFFYLVLFATILRFLGQLWAQKRVSPTHAALIFTMEPVFAAILSWVLTDEVFTMQKIVGGSLIVFAAGIATVKSVVPYDVPT